MNNRYTGWILLFSLLFSFGGILVWVKESVKPEPLVLDFSDVPKKSPEHTFIEQLLLDADIHAQIEDSALVAPESPSAQHVVELTEESHAPVLGEIMVSRPALDVGSVALSPELKRLYVSTEGLRAERFADPASDLNNAVSERLRREIE
ncbi:MAG: hypothetical protein AAF212_04690 [Verrucomicrobiota bacterium]